MAKWLSHRLVDWLALGSHLGTDPDPQWTFKGRVGKGKATMDHSSLSLTSHKVTT